MPFDLIPYPRNVAVGRGGFTADAATVITFQGGSTISAAFLAEAVWGRTALELRVCRQKGRERLFWACGKGQPAKAVMAARRALEETPKIPEGYALVVTDACVAAAARDDAGLFYAATTAAQLLEKRDGRAFFPACKIVDWPGLRLRAVHIDLKHHMEQFGYLVDLVRRLASLKINAVVLELEDKFLYSRRPEISAPVGLCADDLASLTSVCKEFHVELIPLVQGLGHASYILKHPKYARLREKQDSLAEFCPQNEGTYRVLFDLYEEVAAATEGTKYFHIGGDEAWLMGACPKCARVVAKSGKFPLYQRWLTKCAGKVRELGRTPMVWDDMLIKNAGDNWGKLPRDLIYVRWNYNANAAEQDRDKIWNYSQSGLDVLVAAAIQTDGPYVPTYHEHFANIDGYGKAASAGKLTGILTTSWEDSGNHTETFWPGFAATGQAGWNSSVSIDYDFLVAFTRVFHRTSDGKLAAVYKTLGETAMTCFKLLTPEDPYRAENAIALPALAAAGAGKRWRDANAGRIAQATEAAAALREARKVLSAEVLSGRRENSYALEVLLAATRIMLARVDLFFALRDSELAVEDAYLAFKAGDRTRSSRFLSEAGTGIRDALAAGEDALASLESVWLRSRLPQDMSVFDAPDRQYLHDFNNYGHLASKTRDLGYLLLVERGIGAAELGDRLLGASRGVLSAKSWPLT